MRKIIQSIILMAVVAVVVVVLYNFLNLNKPSVITLENPCAETESKYCNSSPVKYYENIDNNNDCTRFGGTYKDIFVGGVVGSLMLCVIK